MQALIDENLPIVYLDKYVIVSRESEHLFKAYFRDGDEPPESTMKRVKEKLKVNMGEKREGYYTLTSRKGN